MRFLFPLPVRVARRGLLGAVGAALMALTSACSFITGVPNVTDVQVSVAPNTISAGTTAIATGTAYGNGHSVLHNSRVVVGYTSSNSAVATVNPNTGQVVGVSEGVAIITASARGKSDTALVTVTPAIPNSVILTPPNVAVGETVTLDIQARDAAGQLLLGRKATVTSSNPATVRVNNTGTTSVSITGIAVGSAVLTYDVDGRGGSQQLVVAPVRPSTATLKLAKGTNTLLQGESNQAVLELRDGTGAVLPNGNQSIIYSSDDITVATVSNSGVVTGQLAGTTTIRATIAGTTVQPTFTVTVTQLPAKQLLISNKLPFLRVGPNGVGLSSQRFAVAYDSLLRAIPGRVVTYTSTDPSVFTVNSVGVASGKKIGGTAQLIATADNGAVADTISLRVTEIPITSVSISPTQQQIYPNESVQYTLTLLDSLQNTVTTNNVTWLTSNPQVVTVTAAGLATGVSPGSALITVRVNQVAGFQTFVTDQASVTVLPTRVATIDVAPTTVSVKVNQTTTISVTPRDANGTALFGRTINAKATDPSIVSVNGAGQITGLKTGTTDVTYQALTGSTPEGAPTTITVTVTP